MLHKHEGCHNGCRVGSPPWNPRSRLSCFPPVPLPGPKVPMVQGAILGFFASAQSTVVSVGVDRTLVGGGVYFGLCLPSAQRRGRADAKPAISGVLEHTHLQAVISHCDLPAAPLGAAPFWNKPSVPTSCSTSHPESAPRVTPAA